MITIIGMGPGDDRWVAPAAREALDKADVVVAGDRLLQSYATVNHKTFPIRNNLAEAVTFIKENSIDNRVVVLASGDPGMYGILNFLLNHFSPEEVEVIPGISSIQLACARLKMSWHDAVITSVHGRPVETLYQLVRSNEKVIVLTDHKSTPAVVAGKLVEAGIRGKRVWVCQNLSYDSEIIREFDLEELQTTEGFPGSVMVILNI